MNNVEYHVIKRTSNEKVTAGVAKIHFSHVYVLHSNLNVNFIFRGLLLSNLKAV